MLSHHPATFGGPRHYCSGDIKFLVVVGQDSAFSRLNPPLLFIFKTHGMSVSLILVTRFLAKEWWNTGKKTFVSPLLKQGTEERIKTQAFAKLFACYTETQ